MDSSQTQASESAFFASEEEPINCKRIKIEHISANDSSLNNLKYNPKTLEERLCSILYCTVCLDESKQSIYQCTNGHLMCSPCLTHLLTDARLKDEQATCPNCRCEISKQLCCRSLIAEKVLSQLPTSCAHCKSTVLRCDIDKHEKYECHERPVKCLYNRIGCNWEGPFHELDAHVDDCYQITHRTKQKNEIIKCLQEKDEQYEKEKQSLLAVINLFSMEKVFFNDLQFKPYKTDDITPKLYFETPRFSAFSYQWVLKARINDNQKNPNLTINRYLSYQLILKSKLNQSSMDIKFLIIKGPFSENVTIEPHIQQFEFTSTKFETDYIKLGLESFTDCNKLLASKVINIRLFMFQA